MNTDQTDRKKSTLRDVAQAAGVSVATVSRVLNKSGRVTDETRKRVGEAIDALGFAPSAAARSLNAGRTRTIGTLVPTIDHSIFSRYLTALEDALSLRGYGLIVAATRGSNEIEAGRAQDLLDLGVDGLIVSGVDHSPAFNDAVKRFGVPVLATSYFDSNAPYPTIGYDNEGVARMAVSFIRDHGHRDIAVIHGPITESDRTRARLRGAASVEGMRIKTYEAPLSVGGGDDAMQKILADKADTHATAIFCLSDVQALGALFHAQRIGLTVPKDISIMGFDNLEWSAVSSPGITTIDLPAAKMGMTAAAAIVDRLVRGVTITPKQLGASIIQRGSIRDMNA